MNATLVFFSWDILRRSPRAKETTHTKPKWASSGRAMRTTSNGWALKVRFGVHVRAPVSSVWSSATLGTRPASTTCSSMTSAGVDMTP